MDARAPKRILIVASRSVATPAVLEELRRRAEAEPCAFALLMPDAGDGDAAAWTLKRAVRLFGKAVGSPVEGLIARTADPFEAIEAAVSDRPYDEIIISTLPEPGSAWLEQDVPARAAALGPPVTVVTPPSPAPTG